MSSRAATPFVKMEGLGNDFLVFDLRAASSPHSWLDSPATIQRICDRHRGVGADGVLAILKARSPAAAARMRVRNADGSEAEMCGNGLRCVAKYLFEHPGPVPYPQDPLLDRQHRGFVVETDAGLLRCGLHLGSDGRSVDAVEIAMGAPRLRRGEIPMTGPADQPCLDETLELDGQTFRITAVSMGNPHAVIFIDDAIDYAALSLRAAEWGPRIETHPAFPRGANVEFVCQTAPVAFDVVVWERGCGITQACGTGACAAIVAACQLDRTQIGSWSTVRLPGGMLDIRVEPGYRDVRMHGPARSVFRGELNPEAFTENRGG